MKSPYLYRFPDTDDTKLILLFDPWILFIAEQYARQHTIHPYQHEDLCQFIRMRLVEQLPKLRKNYKGHSKLRTYISAIILNLCREFRRVNCSKSIFTFSDSNDDFKQPEKGSNPTENNIALKEEIRKLGYIILMYGKKSAKVELALKLYFGLEIKFDDLGEYCNNNQDIAVSTFEKIDRNDKLNKKQALEILTNLFNKIEGKSNTQEATRKWVTRIIDDIIKILNKDQSNHTKETLGVLMETNHLK